MSVINTNVSALRAQNAMTVNARAQSTAMEQLSTGSKVNSAKDNAAGLAIGQSMTAQVRGLNQAVRNLNDGINMMQTAEGALNETSNMLQRMRELAVQAMNGSYSVKQRSYLDTEFKALSSQIGKIASDTKWNDQALLDGTVTQEGTTAGTFQYQAGMSNTQTIVVSVAAMTVAGLGLGSTTTFSVAGVDSGGTDIYGVTVAAGGASIAAVTSGVPTIDTVARATSSLGLVTSAIETISGQRAKIGAAINRMTYAVDSLSNVASNTAASRSTIMDTDYATASTQLSKTQIIQQAATAMLAQANQQPASVLVLLK